ncbi:hypothetical protein D3C87_1929440 [compost metagenome]
MVTTGVCSGSLAVKVKVAVLPTIARKGRALFDEISTADRVGVDLSKVTPPIPVETGVPALPARSMKAIW